MQFNQKLKDYSYLFDIITAINYINEDNLSTDSLDSYKNNRIVKQLTERNMSILGEAANHISEETKGKFKNINWRKIIDIRNINYSLL